MSAFLGRLARTVTMACARIRCHSKPAADSVTSVTLDRAVAGERDRGRCDVGKCGRWREDSGFGITGRLLAFALLLGMAGATQAATVMCSQFGGVIDGYDTSARTLIDSASTIGIDRNCTIKNFPAPNGLPITNINFNFPQQQSYYIVFDNVYYGGNMSCNDPTQSDFWIYWAPGGYNNISSKCQDFMVPVDGLIKNNPAGQTTASIGVPFTYTLTMPVMGKLDYSGFVYLDTPDTTELNNIVIADDLTTSGAGLSYITNQAYLVDTATGTKTSLGTLVPGTTGTWLAEHPGVQSDNTKHLVFSYEKNAGLSSIPAGSQLQIDLTVALDNDTSVNAAGTQFTNTADWWFDKTINGTDFTNLHGQYGTTLPMTIVEPNLVVTKHSTATNLTVAPAAP